MKKKIISMILIAAMTMTAFAGCSSKEKDSSKDKADATKAPTAVEEPTKVPEVTKEADATKAPEVTEVPSGTTITESTAAIEAAGSVDGLDYTNSLIGFTMSVPESWLMTNSDAAYEFVAKTSDPNGDVESLKSTLSSQGVNYLCYGTDTQIEENGFKTNVLVQSMLSSLFGGLEVDMIMSSLPAMMEQQFTQLGAGTEVGETTKITVDGQDVYRFAITIKGTQDKEGAADSIVKQEYIIFMRNDTLVYVAISTALEDSDTLAQQFIDSLSFQ